VDQSTLQDIIESGENDVHNAVSIEYNNIDVTPKVSDSSLAPKLYLVIANKDTSTQVLSKEFVFDSEVNSLAFHKYISSAKENDQIFLAGTGKMYSLQSDMMKFNIESGLQYAGVPFTETLDMPWAAVSEGYLLKQMKTSIHSHSKVQLKHQFSCILTEDKSSFLYSSEASTISSKIGITTATSIESSSKGIQFKATPEVERDQSVLIPVDVSSAASPQLTLELWVKVNSITDGDGWIFGEENVLHGFRKGQRAMV
jgi:hypothetical protein